ncbi:hypothetical protein U2F10_25350 [Leptothoe sp. EHU-05/26/07-4]
MIFSLPLSVKGAVTTVCLLSLIISLLGCQTASTNDSSPEVAVSESPSPVATDSAMTTQAIQLNGKITEVMESWPLQLVVETADNQKYYVQLLEETQVTAGSNSSDANQLSPGQNVQINGTVASQPTGVIAESIEIQSDI